MDLNLSLITIDYRPSPHKIARDTPDLLPYTISVASENSVSNFTTPYDSPKIILLPSSDTNYLHAINKYDSNHGRVKIGYCYSKHDEIIFYQKTRFYWFTCSEKDKKFYYCHGFSRINLETSNWFMEHQSCMEQMFSLLLCLYPFNTLIYLLNSFCSGFLPIPLITPCSNPCVWSDWNFDLVFIFTVLMHVVTSLSDR